MLCLANTARASPATTLRAILSQPETKLNYLQAKLAVDRIIAPNQDEAKEIAVIEQMANAAKRIANGGDDIAKLKALRQVLYDPGPWNGGKPLAYDMSDPYGRDLSNKLLATYLRKRLGNCVSMPILQLILAEKLGLNVSLSTAPLHVFMRYTNPSNGRSIAIEATSGGNPVRDSAYHEKMGVTDAQVNSGIYLGHLSKRQSIAVIASTLAEWLSVKGLNQELIDVTDVLLEFYPKDINSLLHRGTAYGQLMQNEFVAKYPTPSSIPKALAPRYQMLAQQNAAAFKQAEAWGWLEPKE